MLYLIFDITREKLNTARIPITFHNDFTRGTRNRTRETRVKVWIQFCCAIVTKDRELCNWRRFLARLASRCIEYTFELEAAERVANTSLFASRSLRVFDHLRNYVSLLVHGYRSVDDKPRSKRFLNDRICDALRNVSSRNKFHCSPYKEPGGITRNDSNLRNRNLFTMEACT